MYVFSDNVTQCECIHFLGKILHVWASYPLFGECAAKIVCARACQSQYSSGVRPGSATARFLGWQSRIRRRYRSLSLVSVARCHVKVSA